VIRKYLFLLHNPIFSKLSSIYNNTYIQILLVTKEIKRGEARKREQTIDCTDVLLHEEPEPDMQRSRPKGGAFGDNAI
jgi:hypothetical protein